jgi:acetylornithine deacetylase/succinyl-diaminopimelate desuccinylase-like protein
MGMDNYTPYQQKVIKRYYAQGETIHLQRLSELVTELYLAEGKKKAKAWESVAGAMQKLGVPQSRIDHIVAQGKPELVANVVKELQGK